MGKCPHGAFTGVVAIDHEGKAGDVLPQAISQVDPGEVMGGVL